MNSFSVRSIRQRRPLSPVQWANYNGISNVIQQEKEIKGTHIERKK